MYTSNTWAINRSFLEKQEQNTQARILYSSEKEYFEMGATPDLGAVTCAAYAEIRRKL